MIAGKKAENATAFSAFLLDRFAAENIIAARSSALKTALPATITFAPAALISSTFSAVTPPSISKSISFPLSSIIARISRNLSSADGINFCPPKPGKTLITSIISHIKITSRILSTGVSGLITAPHFTPVDLINSNTSFRLS